ncbi:tRNA dimethylallyltransferase [anaerobic digester metagenome]
MNAERMIFILGPTATGKTRIAALAAYALGAEVISADSRQVYRGMDLGSGKDMEDYVVEGVAVPAHLIDIADAGSRYSIYDYNRDLNRAVREITRRSHPVVVCGGSGMYLETALGLYTLAEAPEDPVFREKAAGMSGEALVQMLQGLASLHNTTDLTDRGRLIRAIEVAMAVSGRDDDFPRRIEAANRHLIFGIGMPRALIRERITARLKARLEAGMLNEVEYLLNSGVSAEDLKYYGLEYRYLTLHLTGEISYDEMFSSLNTAIHQFAKRQMTWFRRMEKRGLKIRWLDGMKDPEINAGIIETAYRVNIF